ncbi:hypothetical protein ACFLTM_03350 [Candidatus Bipolaricaulota bacterium]
MSDQYSYGREKEKKVARVLRGHGATVELMPGSRGPCDLKAYFPGGTVWYVEVKATRSGKPAALASKEMSRLKQSATKSGATAVIAYVSRDKVEFFYARTMRPATPPRRTGSRKV